MNIADMVDLRAKLMDVWDVALKVASETGYWEDLYACCQVIEAFHNQVAKLLNPVSFSGDVERVSAYWEDVGQSEQKYRDIAELEARTRAPQPNGSAWWEVLGVAPSAPDKAVRAAYVDRLKQCHPDRVSGLAPEFILLAEEMTKKLNAAFEEFKRAHLGGRS